MKLYVAGPMRGYSLYNWPAFEAATRTLRAQGHTVISPTEIDEELGMVRVTRLLGAYRVVLDVQLTDDFDFDTVIARDLEAVRSCDGIVLLKGWHESAGANMELRAAFENDLDVFLPGDEVPCSTRADVETHIGDIQAEIFGDEVRVVDPNTGGEKGQKLARFDLLPTDALTAVAEHFGRGARKYADRNWEKGYAWGLSYGAMQRHANAFWGGEDIDADTGGHHLAAVAFHALALLAFQLRGAGTDDRSA